MKSYFRLQYLISVFNEWCLYLLLFSYFIDLNLSMLMMIPYKHDAMEYVTLRSLHVVQIPILALS